jgi:hypothetical protein
MAQQQFSPVLREAIWTAHGKKCAYTHELVDLGSMHIDHIIPESLASQPDELAKLKAEFGLPDDFDVLGLENLLPCKQAPNLQKGRLVLNPASAHFFLNIAAKKRADVEQHVEAINRRLQAGRVFTMVQQLLRAGQIDPKEVASLLAEPTNSAFKLATALMFADDSEVMSLEQSDLTGLRNRPIKMGKNHHIDGVVLHNGTQERLVRTCAEYEAARLAGFHAESNFEIKMSVFFEHQCGVLAALAKAKIPERSYIAEPRVGLPDLRLLPASMFPYIGEASSSPTPSTVETYQDRVDAGTLTVKRVGSTALVIEEPEGMGQSLVEVLRADVDGDGVEDILVYEYCYATHGTLGYGGIQLLSRTSADALFGASDLDLIAPNAGA